MEWNDGETFRLLFRECGFLLWLQSCGTSLAVGCTSSSIVEVAEVQEHGERRDEAG